MGVIESFGICKMALRNYMGYSRINILNKNNKNNKLSNITNTFYRSFSGIIDWIHILLKRFFKALSSAGKHHIELFEWFYFGACKALKGLKNLHTSQKSHDQV